MRAMTRWGLSLHRQRLLDAARGCLLDHNSTYNRVATDTNLDPRRRILRCFPLQEKQFRDELTTPSDFHSTLVRQIVNARKRVYLASLYIGPAANPVTSHKEAQLLQALQSSQAPDVKILLDQNRALRPVPVYKGDEQVTTISSAEACFRALQPNLESNDTDNASGIFLLSVLPEWLQRWLPNPYNEVAGVFHLKCYIIDDDLILTGANLSQEYFTDRTDRYLWLTSATSNDHESDQVKSVTETSDYQTNLIECYAELVRALCRYAVPYTTNARASKSSTSVTELVNSLVEILTVDVADDNLLRGQNEKDTTRHAVAYAVPTLQVPPSFLRGYTNPIPPDTAVVECLLQTMAAQALETKTTSTLRLTSAYLNLTNDMLRSMQGYSHVHLLTAGSMSHGFKVNPAKVGNKGKVWIPAVFDALGRRGVTELQQHMAEDGNNVAGTASLWYYQRPEWTFHSKGMWLSSCPSAFDSKSLDVALGDELLCAVTHGSGNYGYRSAFCDLESNLILVLPDITSATSLPIMLQGDWNRATVHTVPVENEAPQRLSSRLHVLLPFIRRFF